MKDVFHAYLVKGARFTEIEEMPVIVSCNVIPRQLTAFSKIKETNDYDQFVNFYEQDDKITCFWSNPHRYLERLRKFKGVITPDLSVYRICRYPNSGIIPTGTALLGFGCKNREFRHPECPLW